MTRTSTAIDVRAADARELPLLEHAQELDLRRRRDLADLVEEEVPAVGQLEPAEPALRRAGERALLVAEQLALEQGLRQRADVDGDERLVAPRAERAKRARDELLPRAALPLDEHGARHGRHLLDLDHHLAHRLALADQPRGFLRARGARAGVAGIGDVVDDDRLREEVDEAERAEPLVLHGIVAVGEADDGDAGPELLAQQARRWRRRAARR